MTTLQQITPDPQAYAGIVVNQNFEAVENAAVYAKDATTTSALIWGYVGGRWGGFAITASTLTLTASSTNYIVVAKATGVISTSTSTTNWNDGTNYARVYKVPTGTATVTAGATEDHRAGPGGVHGGAGAASGLSLSAVNVWTKNQSVAPAALTDGSSIATDASLSNNFTVTLGGNRTLANPTNLTAGMWLHWTITQDGTGSRTLAYGTAFKWPGGTAPTLSTTAGAVDTIAAYCTGTVLYAVCTKAFA